MCKDNVEHQKPKIGTRHILYETPYQTTSLVCLEYSNYKKEIYVNDHGSRAGVLFVRGDEVLLVRQYRYLIQDLSWEIPGGKVATNEAPDQGANREAQEETGLLCRTLQPLVFFLPGLDTSDNPTHLYWCNDFEELTSHTVHDDPHEIEGQAWLPFHECIDMVFSREIMDSMTIIALLAWQGMQTRRRTISIA